MLLVTSGKEILHLPSKGLKDNPRKLEAGQPRFGPRKVMESSKTL